MYNKELFAPLPRKEEPVEKKFTAKKYVSNKILH